MREPLEVYLQQIDEFPQLTPEWFAARLREARGGSDEARNALLRGSLRLVVDFVLQRSRPPGVCALDLIEEGNVVLLRAVGTFKGLDVFAYKEHVARLLDAHLSSNREK